MKKWILLTAAVMLAAGLVLGSAFAVLAQSGNPPAPFGGWMRGWMHSQNYTGTLPYGHGPMMGGGAGQPFSGTLPYGRGPMMGSGQPFTGTAPFGRGMMGNGPMHESMLLPGGTHEQVWTAIAQPLGLTYAQLQEQLKTKTLAQLAQEKGVSLDTLKTAARNAWVAATDQLVQQGKLTREQADWMLQRMDAAGWPMFSDGQCPCLNGGGMMGGPQGQGPQGQSPRGRGRMMPPFGRQG